MTEQPVFSTRDVESFTPPGSPRTYLIAPMTYRERERFKQHIIRDYGVGLNRSHILAALREAVRARSPGNADELVDIIDAHEMDPTDRAKASKVDAITAACSDAPEITSVIARMEALKSAEPYLALKYALRGWSGEGLPEFRGGLAGVDDDLMDAIPPRELEQAGHRAWIFAFIGKAAEGNSASPSHSPASLAPATGASSRKTAANGSSRARNGKRTRG